jgi:hypothetical protein
LFSDFAALRKESDKWPWSPKITLQYSLSVGWLNFLLALARASRDHRDLLQEALVDENVARRVR